ncbi:MAG: carbonic anhydrase [Thermoanaerobaculia bacterium]
MQRIVRLFVLCLAALPLVAQELTPDQLWDALMTGNKQFVAGTIEYEGLKKLREDLADEQTPPVAILACADSRVPPELIFNQSLGALFVVREAGNIADEYSIASLEFALLNDWGTKLIVVLAHEDCGAVKSALVSDDPRTPSLLTLVQRIRTSFYGLPWDPNPEDKRILLRATEANAKASAAWLTAQSLVIRKAVAGNKVKIVPAYYAFDGTVRKIE